MNKNVIQRRFFYLQGQLEQISDFLNRAKNMEFAGSYTDYQDMTREAVRLMEKTTCGMRELILNSTYIKKPEVMNEIAEIHGITIEYADGWYKIVMPALLPHKRPNQSCAYILDPLRHAIRKFEREQYILRLRECVICFRHIYSKELPERAWRDHDNIEVKKVLDVIADKLIVDDTGHWCSNFQTSASGENSATEIYVMPSEKLPEWLGKYVIF
ncbi:hypothetical protein FACS1894191_0610 [Clostridia bacterium]|nr:hypothetical protein FACS1894191_0610 [Clostridia bacterium]